MMTRRTLFGIVAAGALVLTACSDDGDTSGTGSTNAPTAGVTVERAWARTSPAATTMGAAYLDLTSTSDDTLVGVAVDPAVARVAELHEMAPADPGMSDGMGDDMGGGMGEMTMRPVASIDLPAGTTVSLKPGGYHIMLIDLTKPLTAGTTFDVTLTLGSGATQTATVTVQDTAP